MTAFLAPAGEAEYRDDHLDATYVPYVLGAEWEVRTTPTGGEVVDLYPTALLHSTPDGTYALAPCARIATATRTRTAVAVIE